MCLDRGFEKLPGNSKEWVTAWKVFYHSQMYKGLRFLYGRHVDHTRHTLKIGVTISDPKEERIWNTTAGEHTYYLTGFHAFKTRSAARLYAGGVYGRVVRKIRLRKLTAQGTQGSFPALVGRQMVILPDKT